MNPTTHQMTQTIAADSKRISEDPFQIDYATGLSLL